jgi:hypothetical protein
MARSDLPYVKRLRANVTGLENAGREHRKHCPKCRYAHQVKRSELVCDTGWEWVKDLHKATRAVERALLDDGGQLHGQVALW